MAIGRSASPASGSRTARSPIRSAKSPSPAICSIFTHASYPDRMSNCAARSRSLASSLMILPSAASDLALLEAAARDGGVIAREMFGAKIDVWSKGAAGPVTEADLAINKLLHEKLGAARPEYGW